MHPLIVSASNVDGPSTTSSLTFFRVLNAFDSVKRGRDVSTSPTLPTFTRTIPAHLRDEVVESHRDEYVAQLKSAGLANIVARVDDDLDDTLGLSASRLVWMSREHPMALQEAFKRRTRTAELRRLLRGGNKVTVILKTL